MEAPYPKSKIVRGVRWLSEPLLYPESHGDVWAATWADDGHVYAAADDTSGVDHACSSNIAIHRVTGNPPGHTLATINAMVLDAP